jgi:hypothetical protein
VWRASKGQSQRDPGNQCHQLSGDVLQRPPELHEHPHDGRRNEEREREVMDAVVEGSEVAADVAGGFVPEYPTDQFGLQKHHADEPKQPEGDQHDE